MNATYGFEDEHQLYQALNTRNKHGQFAMSIGATSILDQPYLDDDVDSQDSRDDDDTSQDNLDDDFDPMELDDDTNEALLDNFVASTAQAGKTRGVDTANETYPKFVFFTLKKIKGSYTLIKKPSTSEKNLGFHPK